MITTLCWLNLGLHLPVGITVAQMGIQFRLQTSVNRCLQQAFDQVAGVIGGRRQLGNQLRELRIFHQLLADLVDLVLVMVFLRCHRCRYR